MTTQPLGDMNISGIAGSSGGHFNNVNVDGIGKILSAVTCEQFTTNGTLKMYGGLDTRKGHITGLCTIQGAVCAEQLQIDGKVTIEKELQGETMTLNGEVKVGGNCSAEVFRADGAFVIDGMLNANDIEINIQGRCRVNEMGGEHITVTQVKSNLWGKMIGGLLNTNLTANVIEGDEIQLENTKANVVRGNHIIIGRDCVIDRVEYKHSIHVHPESKVNHQIQS